MHVAIVTSSSWFTSSSVGGAEKQIYYIATALAMADHQVDLFTMDIDEGFSSEGVNIVPAWNRHKGIPKLRFFTYRIPELQRRILTGNYDIVYMRGDSIFYPSIISILKHTSTISVLGLASDGNLSWKIWKKANTTTNKWKKPTNWLQQYYFRAYSLKQADIIAAQNDSQVLLAESYSKHVVYIPSIFEPPSYQDDIETHHSDITWIGGLRLEKGVEDLLRIIDSLPEFRFNIIGKTTGLRQEYFSKEFRMKPNVEYCEYVDNNHIHKILYSTELLLNTSPYEGFSNTFLEAWYAKTPVVSLYVDPSNLLSDNKLGFCANGNLSSLLAQIRYYLSNEASIYAFGNYSRKYVLTHHNKNKVIEIFEDLKNMF